MMGKGQEEDDEEEEEEEEKSSMKCVGIGYLRVDLVVLFIAIPTLWFALNENDTLKAKESCLPFEKGFDGSG